MGAQLSSAACGFEVAEVGGRFTDLDLQDVRAFGRRFEKVHDLFGWGMDVQEYCSVTRPRRRRAGGGGDAPGGEEEEEETRLLQVEFAMWDDDANGVADWLEIHCGLIVVCRAKFESKLKAVFRLFDFDDSRYLTLDEVVILTRTTLCAVLKLCDASHLRPDTHTLEQLAVNAFGEADANHDKKVSMAEYLAWAHGELVVVEIFCRFGTTDQEAVRERLARILSGEDEEEEEGAGYGQEERQQRGDGSKRKRASKGTGKGKGKGKAGTASSRRVSAKSKGKMAANVAASSPKCKSKSSKAAHGRRGSVTEEDDDQGFSSIYNLEEVRAIKVIFDRIDVDKSGAISCEELSHSLESNMFLKDAAAVFASMDVDKSGEIDFFELLRIVYPLAKESDYKMMAAVVESPPVTKQDVADLQILFEKCDLEIAGRVQLSELLAELESSPSKNVRVWTKNRAKRFKKTSLVSFRQLLLELFSRSHPDQIDSIVEWAPPVRVLTSEEKQELMHLFELYDTDHSGTITFNELRARVARIGLTPEEEEDLFRDFDRDENSEVTQREFLAFYRGVWNSSSTYVDGETFRQLKSAVPIDEF